MSKKRPIERLCEMLEKKGIEYTSLDDDTIRYITNCAVVIAYEYEGSVYANYADINGTKLTPEQVFHFTVKPDRDAVRERFDRLLAELEEGAGLALRSRLNDSAEGLVRGLNMARRALRELDTPTRG